MNEIIDDLVEVEGSRDATQLLRAVSDPRFDLPDEFYSDAPRKVWQIVQDMLSGKWKGPNGKQASASSIRRMMGVLLEMDAVNRGKHRNGRASIEQAEDDVPQIRADVDLKVAISLVSELPEDERNILEQAAALMQKLQDHAANSERAKIESNAEG